MEPPPRDLETRARIESEIRRFFEAQDEDLVAVYLFGTAARGALRDESDVDVAVLFAEDPPATLRGLHLGWAQDLSEILGRPVDLVVLNFADADLAHHVRGGRLVLDRDSSARVKWEVASMNRYFDLLPYLRLCRYPEARS